MLSILLVLVDLILYVQVKIGRTARQLLLLANQNLRDDSFLRRESLGAKNFHQDQNVKRVRQQMALA